MASALRLTDSFIPSLKLSFIERFLVNMAKRKLQAKKRTEPASTESPTPNLSSAAKFTLFLMLVMLVIGGGTGFLSYFFGRESLRGITQPDVSPFLKSGEDLNQSPRQGVSFLKEEELIKQVKAQTQGKSSKEAPKPKETSKDAKKTDKKQEDKPKATAKKATGSFPIKLESQGVKLDIRSLEQKGDDLLLTVALVNGGSKPVQFIYAFLDVIDNKEYALASEVNGLPESLPAKSETYVGSITIFDSPAGSLESLNLKLSDYPDQKVILEINDIQVKPKTDA